MNDGKIKSPSAWRVWIEIEFGYDTDSRKAVALRMEGVD